MLPRLIKTLLGFETKSPREQEILAHRLYRVMARLLSPLPLPLPALLRFLGSDKHTPGLHAYGPTYHALFRRWKYRRVRLLEIGIGGYGVALGGQSLLAWQAYFPFGTLVAADIVPKPELGFGRARIRTLDQSSEADLARLRREEAPFHIIIDDGSHRNAHQVFTFGQLWDALRDDGVYVVEDVQTSFWPGSVEGVAWDGARIGDPAFPDTCVGYFLELAKHVNHAEFQYPADADPALLAIARRVKRIAFEHNLIVIEKGDNTAASNAALPDRSA